MDMQPSSYDDYPPPPPYYPPYNDQYYGRGGYRGGVDDSDDADDGEEGRDDEDGDDSGNDNDGDNSSDDGDDRVDDDGDGGGDDDDGNGDDSGNDNDGDNSSDDDDGDGRVDDDGDGCSDDDDGNGDDSEEDSSEEYDDNDHGDDSGDDDRDSGNDDGGDDSGNEDEDPDSGGTTNIGVIHGEDTILAVDSRASRDGVYKRDGKEKMIQLTESIVLTRVGRVRVSKALWAHLQEKLRNTSTYLTIEALANSGKEFADTISDDASGKCFIGGIEGGHPILYSFGYHYYDKVLGRGRGFQRKIETFDTMGSGRVHARKAYEEGMARRRGSGVSIDDVKEEVAFALLMAALEDGNTGGKLHVAHVSPTVGYQVTSRNPIESYVLFFDRLGATNENAVFAVYQANQVSKEGVGNICSDYGTVAFEGHPLAKLRGNYYIQRVVFQEESSVDNLIQMAEVDRGTQVQFSSEGRLKRDGTGRDRTERNGAGAKMPWDGNKEEEDGDGEVIILCSTDVERVVPGGEVERKFTQNSSCGIARSTCFRRTKRGTERLVPLCSVSSHVPNGTLRFSTE
ncbi:S ribonuclease [Pyrus ussuriensis x Pyrus communis]|uniref:S ribonuclease n=1 Tax=Pyrus ussuriensis x Pyrus communis TaxID=2448454 RepID=A0A5N5HNR3_9ROSA|nr:S ribonuclease [Pyrus ussuriensis x Pyrus communis]